MVLKTCIAAAKEHVTDVSTDAISEYHNFWKSQGNVTWFVVAMPQTANKKEMKPIHAFCSKG